LLTGLQTEIGIAKMGAFHSQNTKSVVYNVVRLGGCVSQSTGSLNENFRVGTNPAWWIPSIVREANLFGGTIVTQDKPWTTILQRNKFCFDTTTAEKWCFMALSRAPYTHIHTLLTLLFVAKSFTVSTYKSADTTQGCHSIQTYHHVGYPFDPHVCNPPQSGYLFGQGVGTEYGLGVGILVGQGTGYDLVG
jgi:hypothetical protein